MIRFALVLALFLGCASAANATTCTLPNTLTNGTIVDAMALMGNFTSLQACGNNIDTNNIGTTGVYATQIKPLTTLQAIFGGTVAYTFSNGLTVNGATSLAGTTFSVPPTMSGANITTGTIPSAALTNPPIDTSATPQTKAGVLTDTAGFATGATTVNPTSLVVAGTGQFNGPIAVQAVLNTGAFGHVMPLYLPSGADAGTAAHAIITELTASSATTTIGFFGNSVFTNAGSYTCTVHDRSTSVMVSQYSQPTNNSISFTTTIGDVYDVFCGGL